MREGERWGEHWHLGVSRCYAGPQPGLCNTAGEMGLRRLGPQRHSGEVENLSPEPVSERERARERDLHTNVAAFFFNPLKSIACVDLKVISSQEAKGRPLCFFEGSSSDLASELLRGALTTYTKLWGLRTSSSLKCTPKLPGEW